MKEQNKTTSEDYLDNLLNSIMNGESSSQISDMEEIGSIDDSLSDIEGELFGDIEDTDIHIVDEDDYFGQEISDAELFGLDDDIMSVIDDAPKMDSTNINIVLDDEEAKESQENEHSRIHEIIKDDDVEEAISANDSAADDDLQGLLDVMGISEDSQIDNEEENVSKKQKKKRKLFGGKKKEKVKLNDELLEEPIENVSLDSEEMLDLSSFAGFATDDSTISNSINDEYTSDDNNEGISDTLDFGSMDLDLEFNSDNSQPEQPSEDLFDVDLSSDFESNFDDEEDEESDKKGKKSKKGKKEKKEKKEKKKKTKNTGTKRPSAKVKAKREKKVKEKEPDEIINVSKLGMFFSFTIVFVFIFVVIFGGEYYTYNKRVSTATKEYVAQNYTVAYEALFGLEMKKEDDKELFNQIQTVMFVNRHYEAYTSLIRMDEYEQGLYSLLKGVKMFDKYQNIGRELNCYDDMQDVLGWIDKGLLETYGLSESEAREMNLMNNDYELAVKVYEIAAEARAKAEAEKKEAEKAEKEQFEASKENENDSDN